MLATLRKFFNFCSPEHRKLFYRALALGFVISLCEAMKFPAMGLILRGFFDGTVSPKTIWIGTGILAVSVAVNALAKGKSTMLQCIAGYGECAGKRIEIAEHLRYLPMGYFNENSLGEITSVTTNTMEILGDIATRVVMITTQGLLNTSIFTLVILVFDWRIGLVTLGGILIFALINRTMQRKNRAISEAKVVNDTKLVEGVLEYVQGISEVKAYRLTGSARKDLNRIMEKAVETNIDLEKAANRFIPTQTLVLKLTGVAISLASIVFYLQGTMDLLTTILMMIMSFQVFAGLENMGGMSALLRVVDLCVSRGLEILDLPVMDIEGKDIDPAGSEIALESIDFAYENRKIIDRVSLTIPDKSSAAFVGPSGSGKTTLCKLIARFWDVQEGAVRLDGRNVKDYSMDSLMENFSFVFQHVYLFHDTIANNIRFSQPDASIEEVVAAAKKAACHDFIMKLPQGYDTVIGEKGGTLSGGERQRISIARAIMKNSPVIILDEATANVDPENEKELMEAIAALTAEKTVIMIAHRLKTIAHADQIFVVDNGRIVQSGNHDSLMEEAGIYRNFIETRRKAIGWKL